MLQMEPQPQCQLSSSSSPSATPSFSSYSSETLAQIAARVIHELATVDNDWEPLNDNDDNPIQNDHDDDDDFEFAFVSGDQNSSPVSADDIFSNGLIKPTYPLFDRNLLNDDVVCVPETPLPPPPIPRRLPLGKLMFEEERGESCSSSSDESNDLNRVAEGSYCVWTPPGKKKSNSIGSSSSKRWKLRDLLLRSHSDGKKEQFLFVGPNNKQPSTASNGGDISTPKLKLAS